MSCFQHSLKQVLSEPSVVVERLGMAFEVGQTSLAELICPLDYLCLLKSFFYTISRTNLHVAFLCAYNWQDLRYCALSMHRVKLKLSSVCTLLGIFTFTKL